MKHIKALDTVRAFAILFVIKEHWGLPFFINHPTLHKAAQFYSPGGSSGVYLFFVLSGFLITSILLQARAENNTTKDRLISLRNFVVRRVLRIFPIYYLTIFLLTLTIPETRQFLTVLLTYTLNIASYRQNSFLSPFGHSWTLCIEEQFYLVWPWLIIFINKQYLKYVFISAIIIGLISTYINLELLKKIDPFSVFDCFDSFGLGGLYAYARLDEKRRTRFERVVKRYLAPVSIVLYLYWSSCFMFSMPQHLGFLVKTVNSLLAIWFIILAVNAGPGPFKRFFWENRALRFIGKVSYGLYIYHIYTPRFDSYWLTIINDRIVHNPFWHDALTSYYYMYSMNFAILLFVAWISYTIVEKPILGLKRYFEYDV